MTNEQQGCGNDCGSCQCSHGHEHAAAPEDFQLVGDVLTVDEETKANLLRILQNQDKLNETAYSLEWLSNEQTGEWDYAQAAIQELAEFTNSSWLPWWSKAERDVINCRIELVDCLHFMLSLAISRFNGAEEAAEVLEQAYVVSMYTDEETVSEIDWTEVKARCKQLVHELTYGDNAEAPNGCIDYEEAFASFFNLCHSIQFSFNQLVSLYMGKSALNQFRQDKGYKKGLYTKKWPSPSGEPKEDNYFLAEFVGSQMKVTQEEVRAWLEMTYSELVEKPTAFIRDPKNLVAVTTSI